MTTTPIDPEEVLSRPLKNTGDAETVGGYLAKLFEKLWTEGENFDIVAPFGKEHWFVTLEDHATEDEILTTIRSLNRDKSPHERLIADWEKIINAGTRGTFEQHTAELIALGWTKAAK